MVTYHVKAPWRSSEIGRHLMAVAGTIGALGVYTILIVVWPHGGVAAVLRTARTVLLVAVAWLMVQRTVWVVRAQRKGSKGGR
ncbi:putative phage holin [Streptomyces sp. 8L]|uniref:putative phage holin n=1 Tax=Streptomyces sp. 8L TaxID=2877242 RepID=UPI003F8DCF73